MNLEDLTDVQTTTRKMRSAVKRGDVKKEKERVSKRKNPNPDEKNVQPMDGPNDMEDQMDAEAAFAGDE